MRYFILRCVRVLALMLAATAPAALSQAAVYTTQASFQNALQPGFLSQNFQSVSSPGGPTLSYSGGGFSVQASTTAQALLVFDLSGNKYLTTSGATDGFSRPITLTFTSNNITGVGGSFFQTSVGGAFLSSPVTLNFSDGTTQVLTPGSNTDFFGYTSSTPIASLTISPDATHHFVSIDNIVVGAAVIPAPGAGVMVACAAGVVGGRRRR